MAQEKLPAIVARIDERTANIQKDVIELKVGLAKVVDTVNGHSTQLATITEQIKDSNHGLSRRQTAGIGGAAGVIASILVAIIEYFRH
jgi:uncharacterized protein YkvS